MVSLRLNTSPRVPSFAGPMALSACLLLVSVFSEPYWQNFYIAQGKADNSTIKLGAWGACTRYTNTTGVTGPTTFCTSKSAGYEFNFVLNTTGVNNFRLEQGDNNILGLNPEDAANSVNIVSEGTTNVYWIHVVAAILAVTCILSLVCPPSYLGSETSRLFALQKSGIVTILLALSAFVVTIAAFVAELVVAIPIRNRLNELDGITGHLGNVQWFSLPCFILMIPAIMSVLLRSTVHNEYEDL
ncbi:hypothetical protein JCM6882_002374 [Rhodosporidiobolus microsporus]